MLFKNIKNNKRFLTKSKIWLKTHIGLRPWQTKEGIKLNKPSYYVIHKRIRKILIKPCICPKCLKKPVVDLHNIDGNYTDNLSTWIYLCRSCHVKTHKQI